MKTHFTTLATKLLEATHLIGQTIADTSLNMEIRLQHNPANRSKSEQASRIKYIIDHRLTKTMELQAKAGIYSPFNSIQDMTAVEQ